MSKYNTAVNLVNEPPKNFDQDITFYCVQIKACRLFGGKPLTEQIIAYY